MTTNPLISAEQAARCTTHHDACDCREFMWQQQLAEKEARFLGVCAAIVRSEKELLETRAALGALASVLADINQFSSGRREDVCLECHKPTWKHVDAECRFTQALASDFVQRAATQ